MTVGSHVSHAVVGPALFAGACWLCVVERRPAIATGQSGYRATLSACPTQPYPARPACEQRCETAPAICESIIGDDTWAI
jgi:hypothetical protein